MTEKINPTEQEKYRADDWPHIAEKMSRALDEHEIEAMVRILITYYKKVFDRALDDEPSEKLKEGIIQSYGYLNRSAVEAGRSQKAASLTPERQVALELSKVLHAIFTALGKTAQADFFALEIKTLEAKLAHLTEKDLKYIWTNPYRDSIQRVGQELVALVAKNPGSISNSLE